MQDEHTEPTQPAQPTGPARVTLSGQEQAMNPAEQVKQTTCCIVGSGPGGAMLALLLARQGIDVILLEEHTDFERDFRGDTLHPAAMQNLDEIGLAKRLLQLRHTKVRKLGVQTGRGTLQINLGAGFAFWRTKFPYITVMAQSRFLAFITEEAKRYPNFRLVMGAMSVAGASAGMVGMGVAGATGATRVALVTQFLQNIGLGALTQIPDPALWPVFILLLLVGIVGTYFAYRVHKQVGPLLLVALASSLLYTGIYITPSDPLYYLGLVVLLTSTVWNLVARRRITRTLGPV